MKIPRHLALYPGSGTIICMTLASVSICVCEGLIDGLAFISCYTVVIDAEKDVHSSPLVSKFGNYVNAIKCWLYTM